MNNGIAQSF